MRCLQPLVLVCALLAGCLSTRSAVVVSHYEPNDPAGRVEDEPSGNALFIALAERPVGDRYLNHGLWEFTDEQTPFQHDIDHKRVLDQNGFRIGVLGGSPSAGFQTLLSTRTCPNPRCLRVQPGQTTTVDIGEIWPVLSGQLIYKEKAHPFQLEQAQCRLEILPHLEGTDRMRLVFTPQVRHGAQTNMPRPVLDPDGSRRWDAQARHPEESHPWMNWSVTLGPNDYLVIGGRMDRTESLGRRMFLNTEVKTPVQRVLIVRAVRGEQPAQVQTRQGVVPLAAQAQGTPVPRVRGSSQ